MRRGGDMAKSKNLRPAYGTQGHQREWNAYRYGGTKPTLTQFHLAGDKRRSTVKRVSKILSDWRSSRFEREADMTWGLRVGLIGLGQRWGVAHAEACNIVGDAFKELGYKRPTWDQGQPQHIIDNEHCQWCAMEVPEDMRISGRKSYCSDECARSALEQRDFERRLRSDESYDAAWAAIQRSKVPPKRCDQCARPFRPLIDESARRFCSKTCQHEASRKHKEINCATCGTTFRPRYAGARYCSHLCSGAAQKKPLPTLQCQSCGCLFQPDRLPTKSKPMPKHCSRACYLEHRAIKRPPRMTPMAFDEIMRLAA